MRRVLIPCVLALAMAAPAGAQEKKARPRVPPPAASSSPALRGPVAAAPMSLPASRPPPVDFSAAQSLFLPSPIASAPVGGAPQQCRLSCAQTYYFCAAGEDGESCSANWGQCRSGCDAPTLATSY
jgi:hypothetical protein